jgi:pimeloyl-ACP methyl ester carboxylesterase
MHHRTVLGLTAARGFHRIHYTEWGESETSRVLICVHGLTRNGRDFDRLAKALSGTYRVLCPDVAGRGDSDWLAPDDYSYAQYCADTAVLIARSGAEQVDWLGTSMGGIIGMLLAAQPRSPIRRLVINDVGAFIPSAALERIGSNLSENPSFSSTAEAADYLARVNAGFGRLSRQQWLDLAETTVRQENDRFMWKRDPAIASAYARQSIGDVVLWPIWDRITAPVLLLRGADSDLLPAAVAEEMTKRGPRARLATIQEAGHAPALQSEPEIALVRDFLAG